MTVAGDARLTDLQKSERESAEKKRAAELAQLKRDFNDTFGPGHGRRVLRFLMDTCGYQRPSIIAEPQSGDPLPSGTIYNEARRNLYLTIRKFLNQEILIPVENKGLEQDETDIFS